MRSPRMCMLQSPVFSRLMLGRILGLNQSDLGRLFKHPMVSDYWMEYANDWMHHQHYLEIENNNVNFEIVEIMAKMSIFHPAKQVVYAASVPDKRFWAEEGHVARFILQLRWFFKRAPNEWDLPSVAGIDECVYAMFQMFRYMKQVYFEQNENVSLSLRSAFCQVDLSANFPKLWLPSEPGDDGSDDGEDTVSSSESSWENSDKGSDAGSSGEVKDGLIHTNDRLDQDPSNDGAGASSAMTAVVLGADTEVQEWYPELYYPEVKKDFKASEPNDWM
jgi:hypothetical protein